MSLLQTITNEFWQDFFSFRKMVSTTIIKFLYIVAIVALIIITMGRLATLFQQFFIAIAIIIIGNLFGRIFGESLILIFSIHQELINIS